MFYLMASSSSCAVLPEGVWSRWTSWSECTKTCFNHVNDVGFRRRFRSCNGTLASFDRENSSSPCGDGDAEEQEPCNTVHCPGIPQNLSAPCTVDVLGRKTLKKKGHLSAFSARRLVGVVPVVSLFIRM